MLHASYHGYTLLIIPQNHCVSRGLQVTSDGTEEERKKGEKAVGEREGGKERGREQW